MTDEDNNSDDIVYNNMDGINSKTDNNDYAKDYTDFLPKLFFVSLLCFVIKQFL